MKKILAFLPLFFIPAAAFARYDAFVAEVSGGLDHVAIDSRGKASDGELGRSVYSSKVEGDLDVFIPTSAYVRMGAGANLGFAGTSFDVDGVETDYVWGLAPQFGIGWNMSSVFRSEFGWEHSEMRFEGDARANVDTGRLTLYVDLARRYLMRGDVTYRRRLVPFIGIGGAAGYADFWDTGTVAGRKGIVYGGHAAGGLSFAFSETNALDLMFAYGLFYGVAGWSADAKSFGAANISLTWRSSF